MAISNGLLIADVAHARKRPKTNQFSYNVYYLCFGMDEAEQMENALLSRNRFNLFSFHECDHGFNRNQPPEAWIRDMLKEWDISQADGRIVLLTLPRLLGYVFNPVSFWFCLDREGRLRAVISEVTNTFRDRHCYISFREDRGPITQDDQLRAEKVLHVSPFIEVSGYYLFRFAYREEKVGVWIDHYDSDGLLITTSVSGKRIPLTAGNLMRCFFRFPLVTVKVISLIHYQALKLFLKGIRYRTRPQPPTTEVSR
jgi:uncharacterized protein